MLKALATASVLAVASAAPALADGFYVGVERNDGFVGSDHSGSITEGFVGYNGSIGDGSYYIQAGPAYLTSPGVDGEGEISGKIGGSFPINKNLGAYAEGSFVTGDSQNGYGTKFGMTYSF